MKNQDKRKGIFIKEASQRHDMTYATSSVRSARVRSLNSPASSIRHRWGSCLRSFRYITRDTKMGYRDDKNENAECLNIIQ